MTMKGRLRALAAASLVAGCGSVVAHGVEGGSTGAGGATGTSVSTGTGGAGGTGGSTVMLCAQIPLGTTAPGEDVTGTLLVRHFLEAGSEATVPTDLSTTPIQALVSAGGGWTSYPGKGQADGTFVIPGVPQGPYVLHLRAADLVTPYERYVYTSDRVLALGYDAGGRPDAASATPSAWLQADLQNLDPWVSGDVVGTTGDLLEWQSFDSGGLTLGPFPSSGATTVAGQVTWAGGLVDGSKGDVLHVTQLSLRTAAGGAYSVLSRLGSFTGVQMSDGSFTHVDGALTAPPLTGSIAVDLRASQFAALGPAIHPTTTVANVDLGVYTFPGAGMTGRMSGGANADLLRIHAGAADVSFGTLQYPHPFPAAWAEYVAVEVSANLSIDLPGTSQPFLTGAVLLLVTTVAKATSGPIVPLLGPVQDPRVDGQSALAPLTGISTTPTLSWKAPAIGAPAGYAVSVSEIDGVTQTLSALLLTTDTSMPLPPCVLATGRTYSFTITAFMTGGAIASYPWVSSAEWAIADAVTSGVRP
jgi:hypothetical protein